jgi:lipopolysaccharide transport system ATP-binding protein
MNSSPVTSHSLPATHSDDEVLVRVEGVSKKFCRSLKKSLWYGLCDIAGELSPFGRRPRIAEAAGNESLVTSQNQSASGGSILPATSDSPLATSDGLRPDEFYAVRDVSFELKRGECLGLIGHNGAGKTTLLKMLNGLIKPDAGTITMRGRVGALIALGAGFNPILTGRENIYINGSVLGLSKREIDERMEEIIDFAGVGDFIDMPVQNYSSGMQVRLGFSVATALQPDILLLDEVLAVGDMQFYAKCLNTIGKMRRNGTAFILVSHSMLNIARYCDRVAYMQHGCCEYLGATEGGVARYEQDMALAPAESLGGCITQSPAGSGKISVTGIRLLGLDGHTVSSIRPGERVEVQLDYIKSVDTAVPVRIETVVSDNQGDLHRFSDGEVTVIEGRTSTKGCFRCLFASLPANASEVSFSFTFWSPDFAELYDWRKDIVLPVESHPLSTGRLHLDVKIEHIRESGHTI